MSLGAARVEARELTFGDRVSAQEAIERVYYTHQIGVREPFERVMTHAALEKKVRDYLDESEALHERWKTSLTAAAVRAELERMAARTRMPERLRELYAALNDDPRLIAECLVRPILVSRLAHHFFLYDPQIHASARRRAEALRESLVTGRIDPWKERDGRTVVEADEPTWVRARGPRGAGSIGPLEEEADAYVIRVVLDKAAGLTRIAVFSIGKRTWDDWWKDARPKLESQSLVSVTIDGPIPLPRRMDRALVTGGPPPYPFFAGASPAGTAPCVPDDTWNNGSLDDAPDGRQGHTSVWTGSYMVIWGGKDQGILAKSSGGRYDPATDTWLSTSQADAPSPRTNHSAVWTGNRMIVWGGEKGFFSSDSTLNTGGQYDPLTDTWTPTATVNAPSPRRWHTAVWAGSSMIVWGGSDYYGIQVSGGRYNPGTNTWTSVSTSNAPALTLHTAVWTGSLMIAWGGNTGGRYDPSVNSWTPLSTINAPVPRMHHTAVWTGSRMIVWGGSEGNTYHASGAAYDPAANAWTPTGLAGAPTGRGVHTAIWTGQEMIIWGGQNASANLSDGARYNPLTEAWTPISLAGAPSARLLHTAIWTGELMVIWGGYSDVGVNTGGRYDPTSDTWTPTATFDSPTGRGHHTAVWTGSVMIVWGGSGGGAVNSGGRYDPATDAWSPTSTIDAPRKRTSHTAVWTGRLMIVWGGDDHIDWNSGGRYDPSSDTWTPTSTVGAPAARHRHSAVWTGELMVIWGGQNGQGVLNTGGRYDPVTDSWTATSLLNAPSRRMWHTSIWTGTELIVWGGYDGDALNTGGRYAPSTDTWHATSAVSAPSGRELPSSVWTGSRMLVWGGRWSGANFQDGAQYDPATDEWTALPLDGAPPGRSEHSAIWTGHHMVVWGGSDANGVVGTGGRYDPAANTWLPTSLTHSPSARLGHTALWTGGFMLVWGGDLNVSTGGSYALDQSLDNDGDGYSICGGDCNDGDDRSAPGAEEVCDGVDNDCDGSIDEGFPSTTWYRDTDADGFGESAGTVSFCARPEGYASVGGDCDDAKPAVHPGAEEACDGVDNDCDGSVDEGFPYTAWYRDMDSDGFGDSADTVSFCARPEGYVPLGGDCDDAEPASHPGAQEICDGLDNDCDGSTDQGFPYTAWYRDYDSDGFGDPLATVSFCEQPAGYIETSGDCSDADPAVHPGAPEICDGMDNDCNGSTDEGLPTTSWYRDQDGDGHGDPTISLLSCPQPNGYVATAGDCNDTNSDIHVGAVDLCNGVDDDCDEAVDEDHACYPTVTTPLAGDSLDCRPGSTPPTIIWQGGNYERYRVFVSWDPGFAGKKRISSGDKLLQASSWTMSAKKWRKACTNAQPDLYIEVYGVDQDAPKTDPERKVFGDVVQVGTQR